MLPNKPVAQLTNAILSSTGTAVDADTLCVLRKCGGLFINMVAAEAQELCETDMHAIMRPKDITAALIKLECPETYINMDDDCSLKRKKRKVNNKKTPEELELLKEKQKALFASAKIRKLA